MKMTKGAPTHDACAAGLTTLCCTLMLLLCCCCNCATALPAAGIIPMDLFVGDTKWSSSGVKSTGATDDAADAAAAAVDAAVAAVAAVVNAAGEEDDTAEAAVTDDAPTAGLLNEEPEAETTTPEIGSDLRAANSTIDATVVDISTGYGDNQTDVLTEPYIAFNIWKYENGELKLSAVKRIPAQEVLGSEFYAQATENPSGPVMVLADSFVISDKDASTVTPEITTEASSLITTKEVTENSTNVETESLITAEDIEILEFLLNTGASTKFPNPVSTPVGNVYDFVSYIANNYSDVSSDEATTIASDVEEIVTEIDILHEINLREEEQEITTEEPATQSQASKIHMSNVIVTPEGVQIKNTENTSSNSTVLQLLSDLSASTLSFDINETSVHPHQIQVSLINDEGIPTNNTSLINANLISIISNKPTIINHNVYHILQNNSTRTEILVQESINNSLDVFSSTPFTTIPSSESVIGIKTAFQPYPIETSTNKDMTSLPTSKDTLVSLFATTAPTISTSLTPEEQLLLDLENISSFNNIIEGISVDSLDDPTTLETIALKGIFDSKPDLVQKATEKFPEAVKPTGPVFASSSLNNYHELQLDVFPISAPSVPSINNPNAVPLHIPSLENSELDVLEHLLRNDKLPREVELAILTDILSGSTISTALLSNINKYRKEIAEHTKLNSLDDHTQGPLSVIEELEGLNASKPITSPNDDQTNLTSEPSSHTFITTVKVDSTPVKVEQATTNSAVTSVNLQNCFKDKACTFAFSIALAAGTTGALSIPILAPFLGRSMKSSSSETIKTEISNELMSIDDAHKIIEAITKYSQRNGKTMRGSHKNLRQYLSPYVSYLGRKVFPGLLGPLRQ